MILVPFPKGEILFFTGCVCINVCIDINALKLNQLLKTYKSSGMPACIQPLEGLQTEVMGSACSSHSQAAEVACGKAPEKTVRAFLLVEKGVWTQKAGFHAPLPTLPGALPPPPKGPAPRVCGQVEAWPVIQPSQHPGDLGCDALASPRKPNTFAPGFRASHAAAADLT